MQLFIIENNIVKPTTEVLLISPFREIWNRDSSEGKEFALKEFAYIEFMCSPKKTNPFYGYQEDERSDKIIANIFKGNSQVIVRGDTEVLYEPDMLVVDGIDTYRGFLKSASFSLSFLEACILGANKLIDFFTTVDLDERTKSGGVVYKPADVTKALSDAFNVVKSLNAFKEKVEQELYENTKLKGDIEINPLEE
jgi:hypothetical protein